MVLKYDLIREGEETILRIDAETLTTVPSLEDSPSIMSQTVDILIEVGAVSKIVFAQKRDYEYDSFKRLLTYIKG